MKLIEFEIANYRNITRPVKISLGQYNVIIGKNNEGKSNILRALDCAMKILLDEIEGETQTTRARTRHFSSYNPLIDFPVAKHYGREKETRFILKFYFDDNDRNDFRKIVNSTINNELSIEVSITINGIIKKRYLKRGLGASKLAEKSDRIVRFISKRIRAQYIGAIRTADQSLEIVGQMVDLALIPLTKDPTYKEAIAKIRDLQTPILKSLSEDLKSLLVKFIPTIRDVNVISPFANRIKNFGCRVEIDDGKMTRLEQKGDGIQSLVSICLLRNKHQFSGMSLIALEEPEAHLHQGAIHHLKDIVFDLSKENQIIVSTHNPTFIDRAKFDNCVIVEDGSVRETKSINEIRELLGIHLSDSLIATEFIIVCEGEDDIIVLKRYLSLKSSKIHRAIQEAKLSFVPAHGASKIHMTIRTYQSFLCTVFAIIDDDTEGSSSYKKLESDQAIDIRNIFLLKCRGMHESEFEDCFLQNAYADLIKTEYGVDILGSESKIFRNCHKKWSDRINDAFNACGKNFSKQNEAELKLKIAKHISEETTNIICEDKCPVLSKIVLTVEQMLAN